MKRIYSCVACVFALFVSCSDEITRTTVIEESGVPIVAAGENFPTCKDANKGNMVYVEDSLAVYYCSSEGWLPVKGEDGKNGENGASCTVANIQDGFKVLCGGDSVGVLLNGAAGAAGSSGSKGKDGESCTLVKTGTGYDVLCGKNVVGSLSNGKPGSVGIPGNPGNPGESCSVKETSTGYDVYCGDKKVGELSNGADGAPGSSGSRGDDGESCSVKETSTGYDVYCGDKKVGELTNGTAGTPGSAGSKGEDCTLTDNHDGTITQKCGTSTATLYKALCGTTPYDPAGEQFCYGIVLYDKCGGKAYDVLAEECANSEVVKK